MFIRCRSGSKPALSLWWCSSSPTSYCFFRMAILRVIGRQGASVLVRVMGLILCSLAVEIVLTALGVGAWTAGAAH